MAARRPPELRNLRLSVQPPEPEIVRRCFPNEGLAAVALPGSLDEEGVRLSPACQAELKALEDAALEKVRRGGELANCDESVYVGGPGVAFALLKAAELRGENLLLREARAFLEPWQRTLRRMCRRQPELSCSLLCGQAGWLCVDAQLRLAEGDGASAVAAARDYAGLVDVAVSEALQDDEWLYGRAGFLQGLLSLQAVFGDAAVPTAAIDAVAGALLRRGRAYAEKQGANWPLLWSWHGKQYLGAAHGVAGIVFMLLHVASVVQDDASRALILGTLKQLVALRSDRGNWPSKCGGADGGLVHFCHGAPGFVWLFCKASAVFGEDWLLREAELAGETVWRYGLLKKGPGICHGMAGNGYALLALYRRTGEAKWLLRAHYFARRMFEQEVVRACCKPDNPLSLFEGLAGSVCFLLDLRLQPRRAAFPFFDVPEPSAEREREGRPLKGARQS